MEEEESAGEKKMKPSFRMMEFYTFLTNLTTFWRNLKIDPKIENTNIRN